MRTLARIAQPLVSDVRGQTPDVMTRILEDGVNLTIWQRQLPVHIGDFSTLLLSLNEPLADALVLEMVD